jgi:hypothetical protein
LRLLRIDVFNSNAFKFENTILLPFTYAHVLIKMNMAYDPVSHPESAPVSRASTPQLPDLEYTLPESAFEDTPPTSPAASTPPMLPVQAPVRLAFRDR